MRLYMNYSFLSVAKILVSIKDMARNSEEKIEFVSDLGNGTTLDWSKCLLSFDLF